MYGPSKGDMQFILTLALIGVGSVIAAVICGVVWVFTHVQIALQ